MIARGKFQHRFLIRILWLPALVALLGPGCKSQSQEDYRPAWVRQSEARFAGKSFSELARGQSSPRSGGNESAPSIPNSPRAEPKSMPAPPGVRWGETKVTVEVEE